MADGIEQTPGISLRELLPEAEIVGAADIRATSCCADANRCQPGDLFVAMDGSSVAIQDGVECAIRQGARAVLTDQPFEKLAIPVCFVPNAREAHGQICQALAGFPARKLKVVTVGGASGRLMASQLTSAVLREAGFDATSLATCGATSASAIAAVLRRAVGEGSSHAVLNVSQAASTRQCLAGIEVDVACFVNPDHHAWGASKSHRVMRAANRQWFHQLLPEGFAILNADDEACRECLSCVDGPVFTFGIDEPAELQATPLEGRISEQTFLLCAGRYNVPVRTRLIGRRAIYCHLAAAAIGMAYGIDLPEIVRGLESITTVPGRLERIDCGQPFGVFVDAARTPQALAACLDALRESTTGHLICVVSGDGNRPRSERPQLGSAAEAGADVVVITEGKSQREDPRRIAMDLLFGFDWPDATHLIHDRRSAICWSLEQARPGDCVLIAGSGSVDGGCAVELDDRAVACDWLYRAAAMQAIYRNAA